MVERALPVGQDVILVRQDDYFWGIRALAKVSSLSAKRSGQL
jgi:hypothetical protein